MKRKAAGFIAMFIIALLTGWSIIQQKEDLKLSDLALNNIEALAGCEVDGWMDGSYHVTIYSYCSWNCTSGGVMRCPI